MLINVLMSTDQHILVITCKPLFRKQINFTVDATISNQATLSYRMEAKIHGFLESYFRYNYNLLGMHLES